MIREIPIDSIDIDEDIKAIREQQDEVAIGRYMEKYESGTSKPIKVKKSSDRRFLLLDGMHRLEARKRLKKRKIDVEIVEVDDIYSYAVECNQEHGVPLTKEEEKRTIVNFINDGKSHEEMAKIFHVGRTAITNRILRDPELRKLQGDKINIPTINYILEGKKHDEVANIVKVIKRPRVTQIWNNWLSELSELYETGTTKEELVELQNEKGINITLEKLNELIEEDFNRLIIGDCLKEIPKLPDNSIDCVVIDPPYGIEFQSNHRKEKHSMIISDEAGAFVLLDKSLGLVKPKLKKNAHLYIFTSWKVIDIVKPIIEKHFDLKNCLIWNKNNWSMGDLDGNYAEKYEMILFASQGKKKLNCEKRPLNVLDFARTNNEEHPTQKPVDLLKELIRNSTMEGDLVLDYFAGSGSTLDASKSIKRKWLGIEVKDYEKTTKDNK